MKKNSEVLVERYSSFIDCMVRRFIAKRSGYRTNMVIFDPDDLRQECFEYMFEAYNSSDCDADEFELKAIDLFHRMCIYTQQMLPVNVHSKCRTNRYTKNMQEYANSVRVDDKLIWYNTHRSDNELTVTEAINAIQYSQFSNTLTGDERMVLDMLRKGMTMREIGTITSITLPSLTRRRRSIGKKYNLFTNENHTFHFRRNKNL